MQIRRGTAADISGISDVERSAGELFANTHMAWAVGEITEAKDLIDAIDTGDLWVAEDDAAVVGFLLGYTVNADFHIGEVAVAETHQRRGLGRELIEAALADARSRGCRSAILTTDRTLPWNAPYYERLGFRILSPAEIPHELASDLASKPNAHLRCAMLREL